MSENDIQHSGGLKQGSEGDRLDSWKEIATHLRRGLRTVQLWEKKEGLPVHRHVHRVLGSVYAFKPELDAWWREGRSEAKPKQKRAMFAVVPLERSSDDPKERYACKVLTDEILVQLGILCPPEIGVLARRTSMCFKGVADTGETLSRKWGVSHFLEGVVRCEADRTFIAVQLIKSKDRSHVWGGKYTLEGAPTLDSQAAVSQQIARAMIEKATTRAKVISARNENPAAHRSYLRGRFYWNKRTAEGLATAITCFEQALHEDPNCALAYAGLADSYLQLGFYGITPVATLGKARLAAAKAVEMGELLGEAHASYADVMTYCDWNLGAAESEYRRAIHLNPTYATAFQWYADYLAIMGRVDEAIANGQRALELDPVSPIINVWLGMKYYVGGFYDEAIEQCKQTLDMHPNYALAHWALGLAYEQKELFEKAIAAKQKSVNLSNNSVWMAAGLAYSYALSGREKKAQSIVDRLTTLPQQSTALSYEIANIYAGMLHEEQAVQWLEKAFREHSTWMPYIHVEPRLKCLRGVRGFKEIVGRFESASREAGRVTGYTGN